jgi:predicted TIM-barrel fold metal-dependent hydrolase
VERLPAVDAHHHLWDLGANHYPWLVGPPVEAHFGPYDKIRRNYLIEDYCADIRDLGIVKSVHVDTIGGATVDFLAAVERGTAPACSFADAWLSVRLIEAAYASADREGAWVDL